MTAGPRAVRIFLASSAELAEHRNAFDLKVRQLGDRWLQEHGLHLQPTRWEHFIDAMDAQRLQDAYNRAIVECDVFVMLFRSKVGKYTAEEFEKAFGQFKRTGKPHIYTYFHNATVELDAIDREDQQSRWAFEDKLKQLGHFKTNYKIIEKLQLHFSEQLEMLRAAGLLVPGNEPPPPPPPPPPPTTDLRPYLTRRAAQWREREAQQLDRRFVNLTLLVDRGLEFDGPRHEERGRYDLLSNLLADHAQIGAWVLVGLPGSGKSTVLQHHEMRTAEAALQALGADESSAAAAKPQALPELCIWHRLSEYDADTSPPPAQWLAAPGRWPHDLPPLVQLRKHARVRFLLDGLNEIKAAHRSGQLQAVDHWVQWAAAEAAQGDGLAPVFSVRTLDQSPMSTSGFEVRQIVLAPWGPRQIEAYCEQRRGSGPSLWPTIQADPQLLELSRLPFNLWAQCELFRTLGRAARDRAELMGGLFWQMLGKRAHDAPLKVPGILGPRAWQLVANGGWKERLRALPDTEGCLVPWLDHTLQRLHRRGRQVSAAQAELLADLPPCPGAATPEQWLAAVRSLQLIDEGGSDAYSTDVLLRCTHQLWQEFFAARGIRDWAATQPQRLPDLQPPKLANLPDTLARLGVQEPLPGPDPTHWEEPVTMALQLVRDPAPWVHELLPRNLALAGRAAVAVRERLDEATLDTLRQALLQRSRDAGVDLRLRIEAGLALGELGDPRYEERTGPHGAYRWPRHWVTVPAGRYRIGDNAAPYEDEKPETEVDLQAFAMAFAPVTNAEYRCFVDAGGYQDERWWQGELPLRWLKEGVRNEAEIERRGGLFKRAREDVEALLAGWTDMTEANKEWWRERSRESAQRHQQLLEQWYGARRFEFPQEWHNPVFNAPSQPVVGICQFEARAYARWLSAQCGHEARLPTEAEWEVAARGAARRPWPWGTKPPERWQLNSDPAHLRRTNPVGCFPTGNTPEGLVDMAGNVWEWTSSPFTEEGLKAKALMQVPPDDLARRVVRGGSWGNSTVLCRPSSRNGDSPGNRNYDLGFRVVLSCPIQNPEP